jgi:hypothetical protein
MLRGYVALNLQCHLGISDCRVETLCNTRLIALLARQDLSIDHLNVSVAYFVCRLLKIARTGRHSSPRARYCGGCLSFQSSLIMTPTTESDASLSVSHHASQSSPSTTAATATAVTVRNQSITEHRLLTPSCANRSNMLQPTSRALSLSLIRSTQSIPNCKAPSTTPPSQCYTELHIHATSEMAWLLEAARSMNMPDMAAQSLGPRPNALVNASFLKLRPTQSTARPTSDGASVRIEMPDTRDAMVMGRMVW